MGVCSSSSSPGGPHIPGMLRRKGGSRKGTGSRRNWGTVIPKKGFQTFSQNIGINPARVPDLERKGFSRIQREKVFSRGWDSCWKEGPDRDGWLCFPKNPRQQWQEGVPEPLPKFWECGFGEQELRLEREAVLVLELLGIPLPGSAFGMDFLHP